MLFSRWLARTTKRTLCSPTSTVPHAILPSHEGPSPPPSPRRSVKDVLTTPRKGCHETEHTLLAVLLHGSRTTPAPRIMCPRLQESTSCAIAALAAPDGTSAKLVTACGAWAAGAVPT